MSSTVTFKHYLLVLYQIIERNDGNTTMHGVIIDDTENVTGYIFTQTLFDLI